MMHPIIVLRQLQSHSRIGGSGVLFGGGVGLRGPIGGPGFPTAL